MVRPLLFLWALSGDNVDLHDGAECSPVVHGSKPVALHVAAFQIAWLCPSHSLRCVGPAFVPGLKVTAELGGFCKSSLVSCRVNSISEVGVGVGDHLEVGFISHLH